MIAVIVLVLSIAFPCQGLFFKKFIDTSKTVSGAVPFEILVEKPAVYEGIVPITNLGMFETVPTVRNMPFPAPPRITHLVLRPTYPAPEYPTPYANYGATTDLDDAPYPAYAAPPTSYAAGALPAQYAPNPYAAPVSQYAPSPYAGGLDADDLLG